MHQKIRAIAISLLLSNLVLGTDWLWAQTDPGRDYDTNNNGLIDITTLAQLNAIRYDLNGDGIQGMVSASDWTNYTTAFTNAAAGMGCPDTDDTDSDPGPCTGYELMNDLDFDTDGDGDIDADDGEISWNSGAGWEPIGVQGNPFGFDAVFNGNGYTISNLYININHSRDIVFVGLFGWLMGSGKIRGTGLINARVTGIADTGALVGHSEEGSEISASYATGEVRGTTSVGGLVGENQARLNTSYSMATVFGNEQVGGLIGDNQGDIFNNYAAGWVVPIGASPTAIGGLIGQQTRNSGSLATVSEGVATDSYWDRDISCQTRDPEDLNEDRGRERRTTQLTAPTRYAGPYARWNNQDVDGDGNNDDAWDFGTGNQFPVLTYGNFNRARQFALQPAAARLIGLNISPGMLSPNFSPTITSYTASLDNSVSSLTLGCQPRRGDSSLVITPGDADTETAGHQVNLEQLATAIRLTVSGAGQATTYTVTAELERSPDLNGDGLNATDALIIYYVALFDNAGRRSTEARIRTLLGDRVTPVILRNARLWLSSGNTCADLNIDGAIDHRDALLMYYAYQFESLIGVSTGHTRLRTILLGGLVGNDNDDNNDLNYRQWLRNANRIIADPSACS